LYYTIYKITNKINNKIYIGKHKTTDLNDEYMGSGKLIKDAIEKYRVDNFKKDILFIFDNEEEMNNKESDLVTPEFIREDTNYNICVGRSGGFSYINETVWTKERRLEHNRKSSPFGDPEFYIKHKDKIEEGAKKGSRILSQLIKEGVVDPRNFLGKSHTQETKQKMSKSAKERLKDPTKNSQYGTMWITDGMKNKKIKKNEMIPEGWRKGRVVRYK